jgi:hypothetical protein
MKLETGNLILEPVSPGVSIGASRLGCPPIVKPVFRLLQEVPSCRAPVLTFLGKHQRPGCNAARPPVAHATRFTGTSLRLGRSSAWRRFLAHATRFTGTSLRLGRPSAWRRFLAHATRFTGTSLRLGRPSAWRRFLVSSFQFPVSVPSEEPASQSGTRRRCGG